MGALEIIQTGEPLHQPINGGPLLLRHEQRGKRIFGPIHDTDIPIKAFTAKDRTHIPLRQRPAERQGVPFPSIVGHKGKGHDSDGRRSIRSYTETKVSGNW